MPYFDVIVDMRDVKVFSEESQEALVEHQKALKGFGMRRAAVIVGSQLTKMQLRRTSRQSEHPLESYWDTYQEALDFLYTNGGSIGV